LQNVIEEILSFRDLKLSLRCNWGLRSSGMLRSVFW